MKIIVCIKQVPNTEEVRIDPVNNTLIRSGVESIINPLDLNAIEEAVRIKEKQGGKVIALTMGPSQADEAIKILVNEKNLETVQALFPNKKIIKIDKNLAEINMHFHPEAVNTPGIIAVISNELAVNGVNVMETMSCVPEMLWFVKDKDLLKAYNVFYQLCPPKEK